MLQNMSLEFFREATIAANTPSGISELVKATEQITDSLFMYGNQTNTNIKMCGERTILMNH